MATVIFMSVARFCYFFMTEPEILRVNKRRCVNSVLLSGRLTPINLRMKPRHPLFAWLLIS